MQIVIDIPEQIYETIQADMFISREQLAVLQMQILKGVKLSARHGRLIDAEKLESRMYHEAFETDSDLQKWDSGCWIRYKMFEQIIKKAETIIEVKLESEENYED